MQAQRSIGLRQVAISPAEFLLAGPKPVDKELGWAGDIHDRDMIYDSHPIYCVRQPQPTAEAFAAALKSLAGTDTPQGDYSQDFFTRDVVHGDRD